MSVPVVDVESNEQEKRECVLREIFVLGFLGFNTWTDIRRKEVSLVAVLVFTVTAVLWSVCTGEISLEFFIPVGISSLFLTISVLTKGALGMGDGWLMMALGTALRTEDFLIMLLVGMLGSSIWAAVLLVVLRKRRNTEIPFVPFLLLGYIGGVLLWK